MKNLLENINTQIEAFKIDSELQLTKGNKATGTRARKSALEISKLLREFRKVSVDADKKIVSVALEPE